MCVENILRLIKKTIPIILILLLLYISITLLKGFFSMSFFQPKEEKSNPQAIEDTKIINKRDTIAYKHLQEEILGTKQKIHMLEINLKKGNVEIIPVLSHDLIFGYEKLTSMALRHNAYAAVNGGFFHEYGEPSGMVITNGEIVTNSTGKYPVFIIEGNKASLQQLNSKVWIKHNEKKIYIDGINVKGYKGGTILYTPSFGLSNREKANNITVVVEDGVAIKTGQVKGETDIPRNGVLLTQQSLNSNVNKEINIKKGDKISYGIDSDFSNITQAYECGSWIVKKGEIIIGEKDDWVGILTNRDPRTIVGLKDDNSVVLAVIDGRQPGYSEGFTGQELGEFLLEQGINNAAMLDGGASTEMVLEGVVVNRPSFKGEERPLCGGIIVRYID